MFRSNVVYAAIVLVAASSALAAPSPIAPTLEHCPAIARDGTVLLARCPTEHIGPVTPPIGGGFPLAGGKRAVDNKLPGLEQHCPAIARDGTVLVTRCPMEPMQEEQQRIKQLTQGKRDLEELEVRGTLGQIQSRCPEIAREVANDFVTRGLEEVASKVQSRAYEKRCSLERPPRDRRLVDTGLLHCPAIARDMAESLVSRSLSGAEILKRVDLSKCPKEHTLNNIARAVQDKKLDIPSLKDIAACPAIARELSDALISRSFDGPEDLMRRLDMSKCPKEPMANPLGNIKRDDKKLPSLGSLAGCPAVAREVSDALAARSLDEFEELMKRVDMSKCPKEPMADPNRFGGIAKRDDKKPPSKLPPMPNYAACPAVGRDLSNALAARSIDEFEELMKRVDLSKCPKGGPMTPSLTTVGTAGIKRDNKKPDMSAISKLGACPAIARELSSALETRSLDEAEQLMRRVDLSKCPGADPVTHVFRSVMPAFKREVDFE